MAVLMLQTLPDGVPVEMLDAVTKEMDVENQRNSHHDQEQLRREEATYGRRNSDS
jgi:hypothetical protein